MAADEEARGSRALGAFIARRPRAVLLVAGVVLVVAAAFVPQFRGSLEGIGYEAAGTESAAALEVVQEAGGPAEFAAVVATGGDGTALRRAIDAARPRLESAGTVVAVGPARLSRDGRAAYAPLGLSGTSGERQDDARSLQRRIDALDTGAVELDVTGVSPLFADLLHQEEVDIVKADAVGLPLAFVVLLLVMGSVVAAALPIVVAVFGLVVTLGVLGALSLWSPFNVFVESVAAMIGLGVGIDYAMLVVRRYQEERGRDGTSDAEALARTMATAGRTVAFSAAAVVVCLLPLSITGLPFFAETAIGAVAVLIAVSAAALTVLPALLLVLGSRIDRGRVRARRRPAAGGRWAAWARLVMRRPLVVMSVGLAVLLACAAPAASLEEGNDLNVRALHADASGAGALVLERHFPEVAASSVLLVSPDRTAADAARRVLDGHPGLRATEELTLSGGVHLVLATPAAAVDSAQATATVERLREDLARDGAATRTLVGGYSAESLDFTSEMHAGTPLVIGLALALCFLVLLTVFRSPLLALKAIVLNLLSLAAAFGLVVLVFQEGLGEEVLDFTSPGYLQSWMPLTLFMIVFGLSMDYEVFMVSRMREEHARTRDTTEAVALGLERTGVVVTSAALIMVVVFGSFMLARAPEMKQMGFGLAAAVLIDATVIRAAMVPAFMRVAGRWNWWMPGWLDRRLPRVRHAV
ncbi:MMPL family transporter [Conexibacter sp. SYSU D00693]|uniref:MMPL family transporter n=1 Tax=Conexibacter sp. SYSU D00693 TaxID=2812560 RepID=UPI00196A92DA|nr:MMPL family transporter [Conexibacter sp. SYSU D00693]